MGTNEIGMNEENGRKLMKSGQVILNTFILILSHLLKNSI
jgi:hypothetical protein